MGAVRLGDEVSASVWGRGHYLVYYSNIHLQVSYLNVGGHGACCALPDFFGLPGYLGQPPMVSTTDNITGPGLNKLGVHTKCWPTGPHCLLIVSFSNYR